MTISIVCVDCGKKLRVQEKMAGGVVECPACGESQTVPGDDEDEAVEEPRKKGKRKKKKGKPGIGSKFVSGAGAFGVGGMLVGGGCGWLLAFNEGRPLGEVILFIFAGVFIFGVVMALIGGVGNAILASVLSSMPASVRDRFNDE